MCRGLELDAERFDSIIKKCADQLDRFGNCPIAEDFLLVGVKFAEDEINITDLPPQ